MVNNWEYSEVWKSKDLKVTYNDKTREVLVYSPNGVGDKIIKNENQLIAELRKCRSYSCRKSIRLKTPDFKFENSYTEEEIRDAVEEFTERRFRYMNEFFA